MKTETGYFIDLKDPTRIYFGTPLNFEACQRSGGAPLELTKIGGIKGRNMKVKALKLPCVSNDVLPIHECQEGEFNISLGIAQDAPAPAAKATESDPQKEFKRKITPDVKEAVQTYVSRVSNPDYLGCRGFVFDSLAPREFSSDQRNLLNSLIGRIFAETPAYAGSQ